MIAQFSTPTHSTGPQKHSQTSFSIESPTDETPSALDNRLADLNLKPIRSTEPSIATTIPSVQTTELSVRTTEPSTQAIQPSVQESETNEYAKPIYQGISATNSKVGEDRSPDRSDHRCCSGHTNGTRNKLIISLICIALALGIDLKWPQTRNSLVNGQPSIRYLVIFNHSCKLVYL